MITKLIEKIIEEDMLVPIVIVLGIFSVGIVMIVAMAAIEISQNLACR